MGRRLLITVLIIAGATWLNNASWLARPPAGSGPKLVAHRGIHQAYSRDGLERDTCTAARIDTPTHSYLENTLDSMAAAFAAGADIVEIDVHPTTDGKWAVFHDWTLDCRTDGTGPTRGHSMAELKALDIGYGYSADDGATFPFRGTGIGQMPSLAEVMAAFPDRQFLINFKSNDPAEGEAFLAALDAHPDWLAQIWGVYGGTRPTDIVRTGSNLPGFTRDSVKACLVPYLAQGWTGLTPDACHGTMMMVPLNYRRLLWGWPHRYTARMNSVGSTVVLIGSLSAGDPGTDGIDTPEALAKVPARFTGYVWTNKIEQIGPMLRPEID